MKGLEFDVDTFDRDTFDRCRVRFKGVEVLEIVFEKSWSPEYDRFGIMSGRSSLIGFIHIDANPDNDLDFISPHRKPKTFEEAKENCEKILDDFFAWMLA